MASPARESEDFIGFAWQDRSAQGARSSTVDRNSVAKDVAEEVCASRPSDRGEACGECGDADVAHDDLRAMIHWPINS